MDIEDVSNFDHSLELLARQKKLLQAASKRQGERPRDRKPRTKAIEGHMMTFLSLNMRGLVHADGGNHMIHSSFITSPYLPSVASFKDLKKVLLKDLRLETHHRGSYLLLRAVTPPVRMTAIMSIMEDETDDVVMFQLYQQEDEEIRRARDIVRDKAVCIIKEPYYKVTADGDYGLRIDHVSDVIWLHENDEKVPSQWRPQISQLDKTADEWKREGNDAMKAEKFTDAIEKYTEALQYSTRIEEAQTIKINRALAYLKLRRYDEALMDADCTSADVKPAEKGLYRKARALYELGRYQECYQSLEILLKEYPSNEAGKQEFSRVKDRLAEEKSGHYDFRAMYRATKARPLCLDHATYVGPVEIKESQGRGRGLFTTRAVKTGELLLCEKAFAHCHAGTTDESPSSSSKISLLINTQTNRMVMGTQADLIQKIVQQLLRNPSLAPAFTSLHHGSYKPVEVSHVDEMPVVDTFLADQIMSLNVFGCPLTSVAKCSEKHSDKAKELEKHHHSCGIWVKASYINHSCYQNVRRSFIGDMQIVRATRDLPAGTEMAFWYVLPDSETYKERQEKLRQTWGFQCTCVMCDEEKNTPKKMTKKREALLGDLKAAFESSKPSTAERLLGAVEKSYKPSFAEVPRLVLLDPYLMLTRMYAAETQPEKVISTTLKVLGSLGFVIKGASLPEATNPTNRSFEVERWGLMVDHVIEAWMHLWTAYACVAPQLCAEAKECARTAYKICAGEDITFEENYGKIGRHIG